MMSLNPFGTALGQATREMVAQLTPTTFFTDQQITLRNQLGQFLQGGFQQPGAIKVVIATFLLSPPGQFKIVNFNQHLPGWLVSSYQSLYEVVQPSATPISQSLQDSHAQKASYGDSSFPTPDFGSFPETLNDFISNRLHLNRLLGLSNLFYIDPEDAEIRDELLELRMNLSKILLNSGEEELKSAFTSDFADRYWSLVRSGIQSIVLKDNEEQLKLEVKNRLSPELGGGFGMPGSASAFVVAMMFYEPGTMQVEDAQHKLPSWLVDGYKEIFSSAIVQ